MAPSSLMMELGERETASFWITTLLPLVARFNQKSVKRLKIKIINKNIFLEENIVMEIAKIYASFLS